MPGGDRTGPMGQGAMSGRRAGLCSGFSNVGNAGAVAARGFALGSGRAGWFRRAFGNRGQGKRLFSACRQGWMRAASGGDSSAVSVEKKALKQRAQILQSEITAINKQLKEWE